MSDVSKGDLLKPAGVNEEHGSTILERQAWFLQGSNRKSEDDVESVAQNLG